MPKVHQLYYEQIVPTTLAEAWDFIRRPENLNRITPPELDFEIVSNLPDEMSNGLIIEYRIGIPILGKQRWLTEIKHIREQHSFVDEQRIGPYKLWFHYHEITEVEGGIRFVDHVHYALPFGPFGALAHSLYVKKQLRHIFGYRETALQEAFDPHNSKR